MSKSREKTGAAAETLLQGARNATVDLNRTLYGKSSFAAEKANNDALGRQVLKEDLGLLDSRYDELPPEKIAPRVRDVLTENTRQDTAAVYGHSVSAFRHARAGKILARWALVVGLLNTGLLGYILVRG